MSGMFRAALRPRRIAVAAATGIALSTPPPQEREKLPIYPLPTPEILLVEDPSPIEKHIGVARKAVTATYHDAYAQLQGVVSKWIGIEHAVENRVKSIIAPDEPLTPGLLYVGISTLTGSIISRNRSLPTRFLLPPLFLILSLNHFLPKTSTNLSSYLSSLEETYFPTVAEKHAIANAHTRMTWEKIKEATESGREGFSRGVEGAVERLQGATGLKVKETLGWRERELKKGEVVIQDVTKAVEQKVEAAKEAGEKKVEEVKKLV